ncbi:MAG: gliding motility-associated C-terminal domain-containing protein [Bacteroidia bacterium]|nr:gliding motility-associated C-terminal domain-containing protein [Bacteroidia bacterium]
MRKLYTVTLIGFIFTCLKAQVSPTATIAQVSGLNCTGSPLVLAAVPSDTSVSLSYTWSIFPSKGLSSSTDLNSPTVSLTFNSPSAYNIKLSVSDGTTTTSSQKIIIITNTAKASFNATFNQVGYPTELVLTNYSGNFLKSYWKFNDQPEPDTSLNVIRAYNKSGSYTVTLFATGINNCNDSLSYAFRISDSSSVVLPNIFTPNGDDANDVYQPITRGIKTLNAWVYNRYGSLIAKWDKVKGSWDGHTISGEVCSEGVYVVVVEAIGFDGIEYKLKSTITLAR